MFKVIGVSSFADSSVDNILPEGRTVPCRNILCASRSLVPSLASYSAAEHPHAANTVANVCLTLPCFRAVAARVVTLASRVEAVRSYLYPNRLRTFQAITPCRVQLVCWPS